MFPKKNYPSLHNHALFMSSLFGSTYICEQLFSRMKHTKNKTRTKIFDEHLEHSLRIAASSTKANMDALVCCERAEASIISGLQEVVTLLPKLLPPIPIQYQLFTETCVALKLKLVYLISNI